MSTYQPVPTTPSRSGTDVAAWALVALVVALVCASAGWAIARQDVPSSAEVTRTSALAAREASVRGMRDGYGQGAAAGRRQASLQSQLEQLRQRGSASRDGWSAGYQDGRSRAAALRGDDADLFGMPSTGAYPSLGYEDVLSAGLFGDVPGFADSAFTGYGYGTGSTTPYAAAAFGPTSYGDDFGY